MKEINCNIIQDILPLYVDDVVSKDTREIVDEHLEQCEDCKKELNVLNQPIHIPVEQEVQPFLNFKKKWRNKKLIISGVSILFTAVMMFGVFWGIFHFESVTPYDKALIAIEEEESGMLISHYYGEYYYGVYTTHPMKVEIDGVEKNVILLAYTGSLWTNYLEGIVRKEQKRDERDFIFSLENKEMVDAIYYKKFEVRKIYDEKVKGEDVLKNAILIWEK